MSTAKDNGGHRMKPGRKPEGRVSVHLTIPQDLYEKLKARAEEGRRPLSRQAEMALELGLA